MSFITIIDENESFDWQPEGEDMKTVFKLRRLSSVEHKKILKKCTKSVWKNHVENKTTDWERAADLMLDYIIIGWDGIKTPRNEDVTCTPETKLLLPIKIKEDILAYASDSDINSIEKKKSSTS